jgi:hypothetical protein
MATAAQCADAAAGALAPYGNPVHSLLERLEGAWVSPSQERRRFTETLEGAGSAVQARFREQAAACRTERAGEPVDVDPDDPYEGWKTSSWRIDARVSARARAPYGGAG